MISDCMVFCHPKSLPLEECKVIAGNMLTIYNKFSSLRDSSVATHAETGDYKMGLAKINNYFILLSGPRDMSNVTLVNQTNLFVEALVLFLGPLNSLHLQHSPSEIKVLMRKVARHAIQFVVPNRAATFRNNFGYIPSKTNVSLDCVLRCSTLLDSLNSGGVVFQENKVVYTNLNCCLLSVLQGLEETNVPVESKPILENAKLFRVFLSSRMQGTLKARAQRSPPLSPEMQLTEDTKKLLLEDLENSSVLEQPLESKSRDSDSFEFVPQGLPAEDTGAQSCKILRSMSSVHTQYSLLSELFETNKVGRSNTIKTCIADDADNDILLHASIDSTGSELPGNSLNYKLFSHGELIPSATSPDSSIVRIPQRLNSMPSLYETPPCSGHQQDPIGSLEAVQDSENLAKCPNTSPPRTVPEGDKPSDSASSDSVYHETFDYFSQQSADAEVKEFELLILSRVNTTIILIGENMADRIQEYWSACMLLLGEVSAYFNMKNIPIVQRTTHGVNSFAFDKQTRSLRFSNADRTSPTCHGQIKFCQDWCDNEDGVQLLCVKGLKYSTVMQNTDTTNVFLNSCVTRCSKLADLVSDITARNFDSVFL